MYITLYYNSLKKKKREKKNLARYFFEISIAKSEGKEEEGRRFWGFCWSMFFLSRCPTENRIAANAIREKSKNYEFRVVNFVAQVIFERDKRSPRVTEQIVFRIFDARTNQCNRFNDLFFFFFFQTRNQVNSSETIHFLYIYIYIRMKEIIR